MLARLFILALFAALAGAVPILSASSASACSHHEKYDGA